MRIQPKMVSKAIDKIHFLDTIPNWLCFGFAFVSLKRNGLKFLAEEWNKSRSQSIKAIYEQKEKIVAGEIGG